MVMEEVRKDSMMEELKLYHHGLRQVIFLQLVQEVASCWSSWSLGPTLGAGRLFPGSGRTWLSPLDRHAGIWELVELEVQYHLYCFDSIELHVAPDSTPPEVSPESVVSTANFGILMEWWLEVQLLVYRDMQRIKYKALRGSSADPLKV